MPEFEKSYKLILEYEGGYSNDPVDKGGETYKGIARRYSKTWAGWLIIDSLKEEEKFPYVLKNNNILDQMVKKYYRERYWDTLLLDEVINQELADELFDISVNMGTYRAAKFLQIALNVLNRNETNYFDLVEDGKIGSKTIYTLKIFFTKDDVEYLIKVINILQGYHYIEFMRKSPEQEKFCRGWLNRIVFNKE
jgi:lysozyme family protein